MLRVVAVLVVAAVSSMSPGPEVGFSVGLPSI